MEHRDNILCNRNTVPTIIGISASNLPAYNMGRMRNSGWDGEISVGDHIGDWSYFVKANFTYAHNKILEQDEVIRNEDYHILGSSCGIYLFPRVENSIGHITEELPVT